MDADVTPRASKRLSMLPPSPPPRGSAAFRACGLLFDSRSRLPPQNLRGSMQGQNSPDILLDVPQKAFRFIADAVQHLSGRTVDQK